MFDQLTPYRSELSKRASDPEHPHWFCGEGDDEGISYCYGCAMQLRPSAQFGDDLCGGYPGYAEADSPEMCEECGRLLSYTLTDYGVTEELAHFSECGFDWNEPNHCFALARVANCVDRDNREQVAQLLSVLKSGRNAPEIIVE